MQMQHTEEYIRQHVAIGRATDVAIAIGGRDGETYRFFHSSRGDVQNGKTLYDMMSVTKLMATMTICHIAIEEGKISPDDRLEVYFPYAPEDKKGLTLRHLLTHTSGITHKFMPEYFGPARRREAIDVCLGIPLSFAPGSSFVYACNNMILLGFLLEQVYNKPLDRLFDDLVACPLGLRNTGYLPAEDENIVCCAAKPYEGANKCTDPTARRLYGVSGNAGIFSCLDDMSVFAQSLLRGHEKLMRPETFEAAVRDCTPTLSEGRTLGCVYVDGRYKQTGRLFSDGSIGHCGNSGTSVFADRKSDRYVVILSNTTLCVHNHYALTMQFREELHNAIADDFCIC